MNTSIKHIIAREILDSRGNPTLRTWVTLQDGSVGIAAVPSGASTGTHEALELRDGKDAYNGKGVQKAIKNVNTKIAHALKGKDATKQQEIDEFMIELDGTENKRKLGANAILSVSLAVARAAAASKKLPLYTYIRKAYKLKHKSYRMPVPTMNIINGGRHANNGLSIQEFMIVPQARKMRDRVRIGAEVFHALKTILNKRKLSTGVGDEGGFAPELDENEKAIKLIMQAIRHAGYDYHTDVHVAMDWAASEFFTGKHYKWSRTKSYTPEDMILKLSRWVRKYPIVSIEDALAEDDWDAWEALTSREGRKVKLVGDDLFVTNVERLQQGIDRGVCNAILIKVNQIGTLTESVAAIKLAQKNKYAISVSHRSGETADTFIADLAVAVNAEYIKTGSLSRSERVEKYNRLMEIADELGK